MPEIFLRKAIHLLAGIHPKILLRLKSLITNRETCAWRNAKLPVLRGHKGVEFV